MPRLLVVSHTPSPNTRRLTEAVVNGASSPDIDGVEVTWTEPLKTDPQTVLETDAIILGTTENFGYMSGAMKDFFDRIYYPCLEHTASVRRRVFGDGAWETTSNRGISAYRQLCCQYLDTLHHF